MRAKLYQPSRNAMQSGMAGSDCWVIEPIADGAARRDPLMGWAGGKPTDTQLKLRFDTREEALAYAERNGLELVERHPSKRRHNIRANGYAENFAHNRRTVWTH